MCVTIFHIQMCWKKNWKKKKTVFAWTFEQSVINSATNLNTSQVRRISEMISSHINHEYVKFCIDDKMSKFELRWKNLIIYQSDLDYDVYWSYIEKALTFQESSSFRCISVHRIYILSQFLHLIMLIWYRLW